MGKENWEPSSEYVEGLALNCGTGFATADSEFGATSGEPQSKPG